MENSFIKHKTKKLKRKLKNLSKFDKFYVWIGFFIFGLILLTNIVFMTIYLINADYEYRIINHAYVDAVLPDQEIGSTLQLGIVKIEELNLNELRVGDKIIVHGDFGLEVYWVEEVVSISTASKEVQVTYDNINVSTFTEDDILGVYTDDANFMGTVYYSSSYLKGYIFLTISHGFLLYGFYHLFIAKKKNIE